MRAVTEWGTSRAWSQNWTISPFFPVMPTVVRPFSLARRMAATTLGLLPEVDDAHQHVARTAQGLHLLGENLVEAVVVADSGKYGGVGGQGHGRQGGAVPAGSG